MPRLLICLDCPALLKVPSEADDPRNDALEAIVQRHQHPEIPEYKLKGGNLVTCDQKTWDAIGEEQYVKNVLAENHMEINAYKDQLREDAGRCFNNHGRPHWPDRGCIDFCSESKTLGIKDRPKEERMYLCQFCPYQSDITTDVRYKKGMYQ